jgi:hypothetical protein
MPFLLTNVSKAACALDGFPAIRVFGPRLGELPFRYTHKGDGELPELHAHPVRIASGGNAAFMVNKYRCDIHWEDFGQAMLVTFPGGAGSRLYRFPRGGPDYCAEAPSLTIDVTPILPSLAAVRTSPR